MGFYNQWYYNLKYKIYELRMKHKYPDWQDDEYNIENFKFIWGVKSWDDISSSDANMHTMNDIDIVYNRDTGEYSLGIEAVWQFEDGKAGEVAYLDGLLNAFTKFMQQNDYSIKEPLNFWCIHSDMWVADNLPELYTKFKLFVEGYKAVYGKNNGDGRKHSKWEISFDGYYPYCKECGYTPDIKKLTDYCPKCGSIMDGDMNG